MGQEKDKSKSARLWLIVAGLCMAASFVCKEVVKYGQMGPAYFTQKSDENQHKINALQGIYDAFSKEYYDAAPFLKAVHGIDIIPDLNAARNSLVSKDPIEFASVSLRLQRERGAKYDRYFRTEGSLEISDRNPNVVVDSHERVIGTLSRIISCPHGECPDIFTYTINRPIYVLPNVCSVKINMIYHFDTKWYGTSARIKTSSGSYPFVFPKYETKTEIAPLEGFLKEVQIKARHSYQQYPRHDDPGTITTLNCKVVSPRASAN